MRQGQDLYNLNKEGRHLSRAPARQGSLKWFFLLSVLLLIAGFVSGVTWSTYFKQKLTPILQQMRDFAVNTQSHHSVIHTIWTIFLHNVYAAGLMILLGFIAGVYPAVQMWMNGLLMGFVTALGVTSLHTAAWKVVLFAILPHGIFELSAILWASALGIQLGFTALYACGRWVKALFLRETVGTSTPVLSVQREVRRVLVSLPMIIGLLMVAACIEGGVTPHLIQWGIMNG
jgi:stage II sporulation protein M